MKKHTLIPVCPEQLGGMATPREPSELRDGRVFSRSGTDVTDFYRRGAAEALRVARLYDCKCAILKERSPSCGHGEIYDGTFSHVRVPGSGVTAALLEENGIKVYGESQLDEIE